MVFDTIIFGFIFMKMLNYFKVDSDYGRLSELIWCVGKGLYPFVSFLFLQLIFFTVIFLILGVRFDDTPDMVNDQAFLFYSVF